MKKAQLSIQETNYKAFHINQWGFWAKPTYLSAFYCKHKDFEAYLIDTKRINPNDYTYSMPKELSELLNEYLTIRNNEKISWPPVMCRLGGVSPAPEWDIYGDVRPLNY